MPLKHFLLPLMSFHYYHEGFKGLKGFIKLKRNAVFVLIGGASRNPLEFMICVLFEFNARDKSLLFQMVIIDWSWMNLLSNTNQNVY